MNIKIIKPIVAGLIATAIMTLVMFIAPLMGLPKMNAAAMLSMTMGFPIIVGWLMHFMIGIVFALGYSFIIIRLLSKINIYFLKGSIFGMIVFIFAQIMMAMMSMIFPVPKMEESMALMMLGSVIGHIVYGIIVSMIIRD